MAKALGKDAKVYYGTAGNTPNTELTVVREVSDNSSKAEVEVSPRSGALCYAQGSPDVKFSLTLLVDETNAGYQALEASYINGTAVALYVRSGASGAGWDFDAVVTSFTRSEEKASPQLVQAVCACNTDSREPTYRT